MKFLADSCYHVHNQGNNRENLFVLDHHYYHFLELYQAYVKPHCETLCWCLLPAQFHFQVSTDDRVAVLHKQGGLMLDPVTNGFRKLLSAYAHWYNKENGRLGALFRPKTKSNGKAKTLNPKCEGSQIIDCFSYIHQYPVTMGLVQLAEEWKWSSYRFYCGKRKNSFCNKPLAWQLLGMTDLHDTASLMSDETSDTNPNPWAP